jgi:SAM-dependent methyltransferase
VTPARYDGHADWYDEHIAAYSATAAPLLLRLVGAGPSRCLEVGCGTGAHLAALEGAGWSVVGLDASADQLRVARHRPGPLTALVRADAAGPPFVDGGLDLVVSEFTHTDVDDFAALAVEARRVLRSGGRFVYVGLHPCFTGPLAEQPRADGARVPGSSTLDTGTQGGAPAGQGPWPAGSPVASGSVNCRSPTC